MAGPTVERAARTHDGSTGVGTLLRAALPSLPVVGGLPGVRKARPEGFEGLAVTRPPVTVERAHVEAYGDLCGFPRKDVAPPPGQRPWKRGLRFSMNARRPSW